MSANDALQQLQDQLLQLKQQVPGLHLKRATAAQSPTAPFPIIVRSEVAAPPAAERYDVQSFTLACKLSASVAEPAAQTGRVAEAVAVEVVSLDLPRVLRERMATELHRIWQQSGPAPGRLNLAVLWTAAQQQYVHLLTLLPEVLESYQGADAGGGTVRRWAVLSDQTTIQIDASLHHAPALLAASSPLRGAAAAAAAAGAAQTPALPRGLQQELDFLQKRYGLLLLPPGRTAGAAGAADAQLAAQLAGLQLSPVHAPAAALAAAPAEEVVEVAAAFELALRPTDPSWDPAHPMLLRGSVSRSYPAAGSLALGVVSPPLPDLQRQVLEKLLAAETAGAAGRPGTLRHLVRHLENHGGQLWVQSEDIAAEVARQRRQRGEQQGAAKPAAPSATATTAPAQAAGSSGSGSEFDDDGAFAGGYASSSSSSDSSGSGSESEGENSSAGADEAGGGGQAGGERGGGHSDAVLPLALTLEGLDLVDCDALELLRLNLQVACTRCRAGGELSFATAAVALPSDGAASAAGGKGGSGSGTLLAAAECGTCHLTWAVEVAPKLLHERSNVLAHVKSEGCVPRDLLPSWLAGQCSRCASSAAFRGAAVGRWNERACSSCHTLMRFQFDTALFVPHRAPGGGRRPGQADGGQQQEREPGRGRPESRSAAAAAYNDLLAVGQPLPNRGTCEHYRHSYRWLRFPCCGKRFPCDLCHEELTDGHEMKWATRMVCGYCSTEQPVAAQCKNCGKKLATSASAPTGRHTKFWEGGKGQRDPSKLHKSDPRRYRSKFKTKSAKSKRVGAEAKERRERAAGA